MGIMWLLMATRTVTPFAGAWIEIAEDYVPVRCAPPSLPSRERGLKYGDGLYPQNGQGSLPLRERGLKCIRTLHTKEKISRSPRGAWIEICRMQNCNDANITAHSGRGME